MFAAELAKVLLDQREYLLHLLNRDFKRLLANRHALS